MDIILQQSIVISPNQLFDLKIEAHTSVENTPPMVKLTVNGAVAFEAPLEIAKEIVKMIQTVKHALADHNIGPL